MSPTKTTPKPKAAIRRFDIFAEYKRQEAIADGQPADQAKGYGLWVAKIVAARRFGKKEPAGDGNGDKAKPKPRGKWRKLDDKPQTDELFDHEIVERMGVTFYKRVFSPAIRKAIADGASYEAMRDTLREGWKPDA